MDSKMECMRGLMERDRMVEGNWTGYSGPLERSVLKKGKYLDPAPVVKPAVIAPPPVKRPEPSSSPFAAKLNEALRRDN
jgi:3'-5' exoribonuclease